MTISSTTVKNSYSGNGTLDTFNYTFKVFADADIQVIIRDASATETVKTLTTHYTVTGAGSASGGTIVFTAGNIPSATETVVIRRASPQTQAIDYIANDPFPAESHEEGLDRSMMAIQQLQEEVDRSIKLSRTNTMTSTEFTIGDTDRAGKVFGFDASGELTVAQELGTFKGNWSSGTTFAVRDIIKDTSNNNVYICLTAHTSSGSQPISSNTDVAKWGLLVDAASATTSANASAASAAAALVSENNSATSESNASASEASALSHKNDAETAKTAAELAETNAETAQTAAEAAQSAAEATFDLFDDSYLGAKASNPTVDNDGDALQDGALYFDTTNDVMKVYNLANTTWYQLTPTVSNQTNINTVAGISSDVTSVANISSDVTATANNNSNITTVAGQITPTNNVSTLAGVSSSISTLSPISSNITTVAGISGDVTSVANISTAVSNVNSNSTNINTVAIDLTGSNNIGTVAGSITNVNNVGGSIANVNTVAGNLSGVNYFGERYRVSATAPTTSLDVGDLYYDTATDAMKVYGSSGWQNAGSSVNGTSQRYNYTATSGQTTFTGSDNNGNTLSYDAGYVDIYLNGSKLLNATDVTVTSGSSVVLASGATTGDVVDIVAYGTFSVASLNADNLTSGTVPDARITGTYTGITGLTITSSAPKLIIQDTGTHGTNSAPRLEFKDGSSIQGFVEFADDGTMRIDQLKAYPLTFLTNNVERMRIDSSGKVGINNSAPSTELEVYGTIKAHEKSGLAQASILIDALATGNPHLAFQQAGTYKGYIHYLDASDTICLNDGSGNGFHYSPTLQRVGIGTSSPSEKLHVNGHIVGNSLNIPSNTSSPPSGVTIHKPSNDVMAFRTASTERMRIDSSGNLLVGTTSITGTGGFIFQPNLDDGAGRLIFDRVANTASSIVIEFENGNNRVGEIQYNDTTTAYVTSSDYRLKENVSYDFDATTRIKQLKPARFNFIINPNKTVDGFLAHEVQSVIPEAITGEKDAMKTEEYEVTPAVLDEDGNVITEAVMGTREVPDYQGIDQAKLVPLLVKTIQELEARITALETTTP